MNVISVICTLLKDCLVDILVYLLDILLIIQVTFGKIIWFAVAENKKSQIRQDIAAQIKRLEVEEQEHNELAIKTLVDYYKFIKEN